MSMYSILVMALLGLMVRVSTYKHTHHINTTPMSHDNNMIVQDEGKFSQKPDRCGAVAFRCYEPILSYVDNDGEFCGWRDMTTFRTLPQVCMVIEEFSMVIWGDNVIKNRYKFEKTCGQIPEFQKCVRNNQVCRSDKVINVVMSNQNTFCDNLQVIMPVITCHNAWDRSVNWDKLVYTDWRIVQACPATHYRQLTLNSMKLFLFTYITNPSSWTDDFVESVNSEAAGRYICQSIQQGLCLDKRGDKVCQGYLPMMASQSYTDTQLISLCNSFAYNYGKCNAIVNVICPLNLASGHMTVKMDFADIRYVYNMTYWHVVGKIEVDILLHTENKGIGHCDAGNLIFKQLGCFHQYMTQIDMNYANHSNYITEYMCSNIKVYNSCFEAYISSSCPHEAHQFKGIASFLLAQCDILRVSSKNVTCPLLAVYADMWFNEDWFELIVDLMGQYITLMRCKQMNPEPSGCGDEMIYNADTYITIYRSFIIKGEKSMFAAHNENVMISSVCDQEAVDVYNDYITLSTGEQYYQFMNHVIKGFEYIKLLAQQIK